MWKQIFKATLWAGSLDILAAFLNSYLRNKTSPGIVLQYIASGVLGEEAFSGGYATMAIGLFFHFMIAFSCTALFFVLFPRLKFLHHSILVNAVLIALVAWVVTNLAVMPLSRVEQGAFIFNRVLIAIGILIICIGLPIAVSAKRYFLKAQSG